MKVVSSLNSLASHIPDEEAVKAVSTIPVEVLGYFGRVVRPVPFDMVRDLTVMQRALLCREVGVYQIVTNELVEFMRLICNGRTIEVAAGHGTLGRALGVPVSDAMIQSKPEIKAYYQRMGQPVIEYPKDVIRSTALKHIKRVKPQTVIACWHTPPNDINGNPLNMFGDDETKFLKYCKTFIKFGNEGTHSLNPIMFTGSRIALKADWIVSRSLEKDNDRMWIFGEMDVARIQQALEALNLKAQIIIEDDFS